MIVFGSPFNESLEPVGLVLVEYRCISPHLFFQEIEAVGKQGNFNLG